MVIFPDTLSILAPLNTPEMLFPLNPVEVIVPLRLPFEVKLDELNS